MNVDAYLQNLYQNAMGVRNPVQASSLIDKERPDESLKHSTPSEPQAYYYLYDVPSGWTWRSSLPLSVAKKVTSSIHANPSLWDEVRDELGLKIFQKTLTTRDFSPEWEHQLALLLSAYSGTTQILNLSGGPEERQHFFIINYRDSIASGDSLLRPMIYPNPSKGLLELELIKDMVLNVIQRDKETHPDLFKPAH